MPLDTVFALANGVALLGWLALLLSPLAPRIADRVAGLALPLLLSLAYVLLLVISLGAATGGEGAGVEGGFDTLDSVAALFTQREAVLLGWIHFLAFDLFIGAWQVRTARAEAIAFLLVVPCLALTFLFGPAGLVAFMALRAGRKAAAR